jgi:hypothetical protein
MSTSIFARPSGNVSIHALALAVRLWTGRKIVRIDTVETPTGAFYCFVHFVQELSSECESILRIQQMNVPANGGGFVTIGLNKSGGYNPHSPDAISHIIYTDHGIYCVNRDNWAAHSWSEMEEMWVPTDISIIAMYIPDMPSSSMSDTISKFFTQIIPTTPVQPIPTTLPFAPEKKKKRFNKSYAEQELVRQLFV